MSIKFRNSEQIFDVKVTILEWRTLIQLSGEELPTEIDDFDVLDDKDTIIDYFEGFNVIYDSGDGYIQLTNDSNIYYNYLIFDENNYIIETLVTTDYSYKNGFLYQSGQGKKYKNFSMELYNEDGFPLYKIENDELIETSEKERNAYHEEVLKQQIIKAKEDKISDCSNICNQMITNGIEIDGEYFSYTEEDQVNIKEIFDLAIQTNVPMYYHANNESCKLYSVDQIIALYSTATTNKMHHITYFNQLKLYIGTLETLEEIESVTYGQKLTGKYLDTYNSSMEQAQLVLEALLAKRTVTVEG